MPQTLKALLSNNNNKGTKQDNNTKVSSYQGRYNQRSAINRT